jgi:fibronectin type 3 domain-containing protein
MQSAGAPNGCVNLATGGTRPHPGGGVGADHRRRAVCQVSIESIRRGGGSCSPGIAPAQLEGRKAHIPHQIIIFLFLLIKNLLLPHPREYFSKTMRNPCRIFLSGLAVASLFMFCDAPSTVPEPSIPPAPISVSAMGISMSAILVSWVKIIEVESHTVSYKVFKSTIDTGAFALVDTVADNFFRDTGLVPGSVFYYKVSALDDLGESGQSAAVLATTAVPGKVAAKCTLSTTIIVTWTLVAGAIAYRVYRDTSDTGAFSWSRTVTTDSLSRTMTNDTLVDSGLSAGIRYYYRIRAVNDSGESGPSFTKNAITVPATPADAKATGVSNSRIVITCNAVNGAASYKIYRSSVDTGVFAPAGSGAGDTLFDTSLSAATTYYYKISAVNSSGESRPSAVFNSITFPFNISAATVTDSSITLIWPPANRAASYKVYRSAVDTGAFPLFDSVATDTFSDTGLAAGTTYYYKISAVNDSGKTGPPASLTASTITRAPAGVNASAVSSSRIAITWPAVTGAATYNVYRSTVDTGTYSAIGSVAADTFSDTGLAAGATYYYRISGVNSSGESEKSAPVRATTLLTGFIPFIRFSLQLAME